MKGLPSNGPRTHHVHIVEMDSLLWERILFRDYLRSHAEVVKQYAALKRRLAEKFRYDREAYTDEKGEFIRAVLQQGVC